MSFSGSPFKDAIIPTSSGPTKPVLSSPSDRPGDGGVGTVTPKDLPLNDLHHGTPDKA